MLATVTEVIFMVNDEPKFGEAPQGWYFLDGEWWLTWDALPKALETTGKKIAEIIL
jgi:hypothetical protein